MDMTILNTIPGYADTAEGRKTKIAIETRIEGAAQFMDTMAPARPAPKALTL